MAKIVLAFHNHIALRQPTDVTVPVPAFYEGFIKGLQDAGNELLVYNHATSEFWSDNCDNYEPPEDVKLEISIFNPNLVILFNNSFYDISKIVNCPIVIYEVDSPLYYSNKKSLKKSGNKFLYCTAQSSNVDLISELYRVNKKNIIHIPYFSMVQAEKKPIKTNICFIGSKFMNFCSESTFGRFMKTSPDEPEIEEFKKVVKALIKNPFLDSDKIFDICKINSQKVKWSFDKDNLIWFISDTNRIRVLSQIADLGLNLYGSKNWISDLTYEPEVTLSYKNVNVFSLKQNQDIYNSSKIGININHLQATHGFSWRVCDIMASNACLVSSYASDFKLLFPGVNIPTFTSRFEARDLCVKLLNNESMRKDIVFKCQEVINNNYRFEHLLAKLESFVNIKLHTEYVNNKIKTIFIKKNNNAFFNTLKKKQGKKREIFFCGLLIMSNIISGGRVQLNKKYQNILKDLQSNLIKLDSNKKNKDIINFKLKLCGYCFSLIILQIPGIYSISENKRKILISKLERLLNVV